MGELNMITKTPSLNELIEDHKTCSLISKPTYFKGIDPTCIDKFLSN